jgi:hypothetical protein
MAQEPELLEAQALLTGPVICESPRWHDGRLRFAHWGTGEIVAVDLEGNLCCPEDQNRKGQARKRGRVAPSGD